MALRLILLALVALMSLELPSSQDFRSWSNDGNHWMDARLADLSHLRTRLEQAFSGPAQVESTATPDPLTVEIAQIRSDVAFETAMDGLASSFRADLNAIEVKLPVAEAAPVAVARSEDAAKVTEPAEPACFDPELEATPPAAITISNEASAQADRLTSAFRLTRQALSAWASLIEASAEDTR